MHRRTTVASVLVMAMLGTSLAEAGRAQEPPGATVASALTEGARVRLLWSTANARVSGVVVGVDGTVVTIAPDGGLPLKIPLRSVTKMDVSLGAKRNTLKGLAIGVLSGIAMGFAVSLDPETCNYPESTSFCSRGEAVGGFTLVFGGIGAAVGAMIWTERWAPISVGLRTSGEAKGRAAEVAVAVRF